MNQPIKMLRYNTGTDKKAFVQFKKNFDAAIFNATIVAYSGASVADLISMHAHKYIIDPQTHIFQQDIAAITSDAKNPQKPIKKSVQKYLEQLPNALTKITVEEKRPLTPTEIEAHINELVDAVYNFETKFVFQYIQKKSMTNI